MNEVVTHVDTNTEASLSDFIATVSHELRAPLFSILGFTKLLLDDKASNEETRREFLTLILRQTTQLARIVDDMLDLARLDAGTAPPLQLEPVDVGLLIQDVLTRARGVADEKHITLETHVAAGLAPIRTDLGRLTEVLDNLVGNALKFTQDGGTVGVSAERDAGEDSVRLAVRDNGIGIPPEAIGRVFDRFFQLDHSPLQKTAGLGLGLYISRQLVELLGGEIGVRSISGKGSEFWVRVPCHSVSPSGADRHTISTSMPGKDA